mgnify:CR=1 FL=1
MYRGIYYEITGDDTASAVDYYDLELAEIDFPDELAYGGKSYRVTALRRPGAARIRRTGRTGRLLLILPLAAGGKQKHCGSRSREHSLSIHNCAQQIEKMERRGMNPEDFESYLMLHRYGAPPHGGLGLGLERLTARLLGMENVRQAALL